ncbi:hypothetical protein PsYK624_061800 [Phanerochaete sordida]|uniref:Uncharacterized protein n=1 Tax=Phanerochaete sordida TaxID=48140 RepID=A0A9P3LDL4_9APHY|nr:hypothetical protein PsYK624_061800 [Phanerochaete sordida]
MGSDKNRADDYTRESTLVRHVPLFEDVPIDIWYHAIDMIDGSDTLKACAVTCRAFLRRCRYRLFRCCVLRTFHDAKLLVRALRKDVDSRSFVRELHLSFNAATKPTGPVAKFLLPMLSDLQALWITGGRGSGIHPSFCASLFPVSQTVTKLILPTYVPDNIPDLSGLVLALPCLTTLSVNPSGYPAFKTGNEIESLPAQGAESGQHQLSDVHFSTFMCSSDASTPAVILWLRNTSVPLALRRIHICMGIDANSILNMQALVYMGQNLHTLVLEMRSWRDPEFVIVLPKAWSLRSLKITTYNRHIAAALDVVTSLPPATLQDLCLVLSTGGWSDSEPVPTCIDWGLFVEVRAFNGALARLSSLKRLNIGCSMYKHWRLFEPSSEECRDYILKTWLPDVDPRLWVDTFGDTFLFSEVW